MHSVRHAVIVLTVASSACLFATDPDGRLDLELELSRTLVWAPTGLDITVRAINNTSFVVTIPAGRGTCVLGFEMTNATDSVVAQRGCFVTFQELAGVDDADEVVVAPRDTIGETFSMAGFFRWTPGFYEVSGLLFSGDNVHRTEPTQFLLQCREPDWPRC